MTTLTTAQLNWFDDGCCDVRYLDLWDQQPLNFHPESIIDESWHHDHYDRVIGYDSSGELFEIASQRLLRYEFYPKSIISPTSDFSLNARKARVGDRIVQRIHLFQAFGRPVLDVVAMTEVTQLVDEPRRAVLAYATVATHVEQGEWSAMIEWQGNDEVLLSINAISRPAPAEPKRNYGYMRALQKQAHHQGMNHFVDLVKTAVSPSVRSNQ